MKLLVINKNFPLPVMLLLMALGTYSVSLFANPETDNAVHRVEPMPGRQAEAKQLIIAKAALALALEAYADQQAACKKQASLLPIKAIQALGLSQAELKMALSYFGHKSYLDCSRIQLDSLITHLTALAQLAPQETAKASLAAEGFTEELIKLWQLKQSYRELDPEARDKLAKIEALRKPFLLLESAELLGL